MMRQRYNSHGFDYIFMENAMCSSNFMIIWISCMQDQLLSHLIVCHTDSFCRSVIFPVLAGLVDLENTSVTAHKPAVPYVSIPHTFILFAKYFLPFVCPFIFGSINPTAKCPRSLFPLGCSCCGISAYHTPASLPKVLC